MTSFNINNSADWAVIFDVDGTLVDNMSWHRRAWIEFGRLNNIPIDEKFYAQNIHSRSNAVIAQNVLMKYLSVSFEQAYKAADKKEEIYRSLYAGHVREIAGLSKLLCRLAQENIPMAVASNSPAANVGLVLDELNIRHYFRSFVDATAVSSGKPDPDMFLISAKNLGVRPQRCIIIEDSMSGFMAAERADMGYIAITAGCDHSQPYKQMNPMAVHYDFTTLTVEELAGYMRQ